MAAIFIRKTLPQLARFYLLFSLSHCSYVKCYAYEHDITAEEIVRRKSLIRSYIEETHEDWIETYDLYVNPLVMKSRAKNIDENHNYRHIQSEAEMLIELENHEKNKYWVGNGNDQHKLSGEEKLINIDLEEREQRREIVENFLPELLNLEKNDEGSSLDSNLKISRSGNKNSKAKTDGKKENLSHINMDSSSAEINEFKSVSKRCSCSTVKKEKEQYYLTHWLKKLLRKISNVPSTSSKTLSFFLSQDLFMEITDLASVKFDLNFADELISDLISNATISYGYTVGFFNFDGTLSFYIFLIVVAIVVLIVVVLVLFLIFYYFPLFKYIVFILISFLWFYVSKYQQVLAKKHAVVSGISPSNCESILSTESGIFAHIKEYFRYHRYNDDCEKYYRALLIDPLAELPLSIVFTEYFSATFFQCFIPMASALNTFVKNLFREMSYQDQIILLIVFFFCMLVRNKYTLKFPFFMGSIEAPPPVIPVGSRVEDLQLKSHPEKEKSIVTISNKYGSSIIHQANNCSSLIILNDKDYLCNSTNISFRHFFYTVLQNPFVRGLLGCCKFLEAKVFLLCNEEACPFMWLTRGQVDKTLNIGRGLKCKVPGSSMPSLSI